MRFKQYNDGSCDIEFSWKERIILFKNGKLHLTDENLRHFGNNLVRIVSEWQLKFKDNLKNLKTTEDSTMEGK
jgi:hypothetical protein